MKKTAVVYDKWLHTLGGGEVVACSMARILKDAGYDVTLVGGKSVPPEIIKEKLHIDLSDIDFAAVWNDPVGLKRLTKGKNLFINASFTDFSFGHARKNILYPHFPIDPFAGLKGWLLNRAVLPFLSKIVKQVEFIIEPELAEVKKGHLAYLLGKRVRIAFSNLDPGKSHVLKFSLFFENFLRY